MAKWIVEDFGKTTLEKLDTETMRRIRREMVQNGAKVLQREMQTATSERHHVRSGDMRQSMEPGTVYEDVEGTYIDVCAGGYDRRGVANEMKLHIINYGYYNVASGAKHRKKDFYLNERFRKKCAPRIVSVMQATLSKCMEELDK